MRSISVKRLQKRWMHMTQWGHKTDLTMGLGGNEKTRGGGHSATKVDMP